MKSSDDRNCLEKRHPLKSSLEKISIEKTLPDKFDLGRGIFADAYQAGNYIHVSIRFYNKFNGDWRPSKNGIDLTLGQWRQLLDNAPEINRKLVSFY